jgi:hypothetical protein
MITARSAENCVGGLTWMESQESPHLSDRSKNELRVCAARRRRRSSVGRTRSVERWRLGLWRFHHRRSVAGLMTAAQPVRPVRSDCSIAAGSDAFETIGNVRWSKVGPSAALVTGVSVEFRGTQRPDRMMAAKAHPHRSWRHGLLRRMRRERADEDQPPLMRQCGQIRGSIGGIGSASECSRDGKTSSCGGPGSARAVPAIAASAAPVWRCGVVRDATDRSSGPCGTRAAARAGGIGA